MDAIWENFWFNDWYYTVCLAYCPISRKWMCCFLNGSIRWKPISDLENCSPFSKSASQSIILCTSLAKTIKTMSCCLIIRSWNWPESDINFNTALNALFLKCFNESLRSIDTCISCCLIIHDNATDVVLKVRCGEHKFSIWLPVVMCVLDIDSFESFTNSHIGFIYCQNTFSYLTNILGSLDELFFKTSWCFS